MLPLLTPWHPFESVTIDLVINLPATDCGHDVIYTVVNRLYKFIYFINGKHIANAADLA